VIEQVIEAPSFDGHSHVTHVCEVRRTESARFVVLPEEQLLGWPMQGAPLLDAALQGPEHFVAELTGEAFLQPDQQRLGLQARRPLQFRLHFRPNRRQRIDTRPPAALGLSSLARHLALPILGRRLAIHARLQGRHLQRRLVL
jgi:hypothetical protein